MEFRFNLNELFHEPCVEIGNTLIPPGFAGDKRALWDTQSKVTQIVNAIGEASAHAQGLSKPITTADRLRNSEHRLYLLIDQAANNGKGAVTGMLKTGEKGLYVFDREGQHYQVSPPCVLDFYIHESRQRTGFGRRLFEHMLEREQLQPNKMAIDRPSDKFLGFLNKHYGLNTPVKQMNNYVVFDGFFPNIAATSNKIPTDKSNTPTKKQSANGLQQSYHSSPYGRYAAAHPACSMGEIIHNDSPVVNRNQEPTGVKSEPVVTQGGLYPSNDVYNNQSVWQTTQSVPNVPFAQNQNPYIQNNNSMPQNPNYYYMAQGDVANQNVPQTYFAQNRQYSTPQVVQQPTRTKEPLIPQSFDGTPRKMPHSAQSMPSQGDRTDKRQIPAPFAVQNTVSVPNNYQQQQMNNFPTNVQHYETANINNQQPTVPQNVAHMNQMNPAMPHQLQNEVTNSQINPIVNYTQENPGIPQQIQNDVTNQIMQNNSQMDIGNQNQANHPGVARQTYNDGTNQMNSMINQNQANLVGGSQMVPTMNNQNQSNPGVSQMNTMTNQNQANLVGGSQNMVPTMINNQNQSNPGVSHMNNTITNQNQANLAGGSQNQNQPNPGVSQMNTMTNQNQVNLVGGSQMVPPMNNQNQSNPGVSQMNPTINQNSAGSNPNQMNQNQSQMNPNQVTSQADNQNNTIPSIVDQNQNVQQIMPNTVSNNQQQKLNNEVNSYPQMFNQFANMAVASSINNQQTFVSNDQCQSMINAAPQQNLIQPVHEDSSHDPQAQSTANDRTPNNKADRPNSLNIEINDDEEELFNMKIEPERGQKKHFDHGDGDTDVFYGDGIDAIEEEIRDVKIAPKGSSPLSTGSKSPGIEAAGYVTPGRNTPGMKTDQGYYDLKFYHNKLW